MSSANWWAQKLAGQPAQPAQRPVNNPMPPSQTPMTPYVPPQQNTNLSKAQSANQTEACPECGSGNYMKIQNAAPRCYDCGYPLSQSGSKYGTLQGAKVEGSTKQASGNDTANNWNPQGIIGRLE